MWKFYENQNINVLSEDRMDNSNMPCWTLLGPEAQGKKSAPWETLIQRHFTKLRLVFWTMKTVR